MYWHIDDMYFIVPPAPLALFMTFCFETNEHIETNKHIGRVCSVTLLAAQ